MSPRLLLGLLWGFALGVSVSGLLDYLEAQAENTRRHPDKPVLLDLTGRKPA